MSDTVNQLQLLQQNMESLMEQKRAMQEQLFELDSAMQSLPGSKQSYKIVGKLLIAKDVNELQTELKEEHNQFELQMNEIETQERAIKEKMQTLQKELLEETKQ
tara:strand:- start:1820 stop:2131 length:312 start_codon:yes stop_codon:yes gene_type:complete